MTPLNSSQEMAHDPGTTGVAFITEEAIQYERRNVSPYQR